jgi:hypothetical protein
MAKKKDESEIICTKCGNVVTAKMLIGRSMQCPMCDEPDVRYFDIGRPNNGINSYPLGEEEEST